MKDERATQDKKRYDKPTLKMYGTLSNLTSAVASLSKNADGGTGSTNKTR